MTIKQIAPNFAVSDQITELDIEKIRVAGFKMIINNRPDMEGDGQPLSAELESLAKQNGIIYLHIPITGNELPEGSIQRFKKSLEAASGSVLAFCRTGTRSTRIWAMSQAGSLANDEIIAKAAMAGYNLNGMRAALELHARPIQKPVS